MVTNFTYNTSTLILNGLYALGAAALISFVTFLGLGSHYRRKLDHEREECRQLLTKLLENRLGDPTASHLHDPAGDQAPTLKKIGPAAKD